MELLQVTDIASEKKFIEIHKTINRDNPEWVSPLDKDVSWVFDPSKNKAHREGEIIRWILEREGTVIGRIAAFVHPKYKNKGDKYKVGQIGFFDCIDDQYAANCLFDAAKDWLLTKGVQAFDGPINFGERDKFWGLLVEGFHQPLYGMSYNPPYYQKLFEEYGFEVFYNQICWDMNVLGEEQLTEKAYQLHAEYALDPDFSARYLKLSQMDKIAEDFCHVYNLAWAQHEGNKEMTIDTAMKIMTALKPIADEKLIWFAYYKNKPIALWINIPNINQLIKKFEGKLNLLNKLRLWFELKTRKSDKIVGLIFGIVPEFQGKGIDSYIIVEGEKVIKRDTNYRSIELLWQGDFNPKMLSLTEKMGAERSRRLVTYRYLMNRSEKFERHPMLN